MAELSVSSKKNQIFLNIFIILTIICFSIPVSYAASISTYSYVDTIGPVIEESDIYSSSCTPGIHAGSGSYQESTKTNGGHVQETKTLGFTSESIPVSQNNIESSKILTYDSNSTGGTMMATESLSLTSATNLSSGLDSSCNFGLDESEQGNATTMIRAESSLTGITSIAYSSHGAVRFQGDESNRLEYSTHIEPNSGEEYAQGTVQTGFTYQNGDSGSVTKGKDSIMVSGLIAFVDRVISGGHEGVTSTDSSSVSGVTIIDTSYLQESSETSDTGNQSAGWKTYQADVMATGGEFNQTRQLDLSRGIETDWIFTYETNETQGGTITAKEIVAAGGTTQGSNLTSGSCVFADRDGDNDATGYAEAVGSMDMMGVSHISAQTSSNVPDTIGSAQVTYETSMIYPVQYDPSINQTVSDINSDGSYEDLNNNGRLDLHDIILLFTGYESIKNSVNNTMYDYNMNGRFDLADLVFLFEKT